MAIVTITCVVPEAVDDVPKDLQAALDARLGEVYVGEFNEPYNSLVVQRVEVTETEI